MAYQTGAGEQGLSALMQRPSHGTIDFMGFARGAAMADEMNWRDRVRQQDRDRLDRSREDETHERQARTYMASMLTNMQTAASAGVDPTDYFIQQREQMMADPNFQAMPAEVQHLVINRMGNSVALQMQALKNSGDMQGMARLSEAFGLTNPDNPAALAAASGDYAQQIQAVNQMYGSNIQLSPDGTTVDWNGMQMPAHEAIAALNQAGNRPEGLQMAMLGWSNQQDFLGRRLDSLGRMGFDEFGNQLATPQSPQDIANLYLPPQGGQSGWSPGLGTAVQPNPQATAQPQALGGWAELLPQGVGAAAAAPLQSAMPGLPGGIPVAPGQSVEMPGLPGGIPQAQPQPVGLPQPQAGVRAPRPSMLGNLGRWIQNHEAPQSMQEAVGAQRIMQGR